MEVQTPIKIGVRIRCWKLKVQVGVSGINKEKLLVIGTEGTTKVVIEVEGEARDGMKRG